MADVRDFMLAPREAVPEESPGTDARGLMLADRVPVAASGAPTPPETTTVKMKMPDGSIAELGIDQAYAASRMGAVPATEADETYNSYLTHARDALSQPGGNLMGGVLKFAENYVPAGGLILTKGLGALGEDEEQVRATLQAAGETTGGKIGGLAGYLPLPGSAANLAGKLGEKVGEKIAGKALSTAAKWSAEGAAFGVQDALNEGNIQHEPIDVERLVHGAVTGAVLNNLFGLGFTGVSKGLGAAFGKKPPLPPVAGQQDVQHELMGAWTDADKATAEAFSKKTGRTIEPVFELKTDEVKLPGFLRKFGQQSLRFLNLDPNSPVGKVADALLTDETAIGNTFRDIARKFKSEGQVDEALAGFQQATKDVIGEVRGSIADPTVGLTKENFRKFLPTLPASVRSDARDALAPLAKELQQLRADILKTAPGLEPYVNDLYAGLDKTLQTIEPGFGQPFNAYGGSLAKKPMPGMDEVLQEVNAFRTQMQNATEHLNGLAEKAKLPGEDIGLRLKTTPDALAGLARAFQDVSEKVSFIQKDKKIWGDDLAGAITDLFNVKTNRMLMEKRLLETGAAKLATDVTRILSPKNLLEYVKTPWDQRVIEITDAGLNQALKNIGPATAGGRNELKSIELAAYLTEINKEAAQLAKNWGLKAETLGTVGEGTRVAAAYLKQLQTVNTVKDAVRAINVNAGVTMPEGLVRGLGVGLGTAAGLVGGVPPFVTGGLGYGGASILAHTLNPAKYLNLKLQWDGALSKANTLAQKAAAQAGTGGVSTPAVVTQKNYREFAQKLFDTLSRQEQLVKGVHSVTSQYGINETLTTDVAAKTQEILKFLAEKLPRRPDNPSVFTPNKRSNQAPSQAELTKYNRYVQGAIRPYDVVKSPTKEGWEAVKTLYPNDASAIQTLIMEHIAENPGVASQYNMRQRLNLIFGGVDVVSDPQKWALLQDSYYQKPQSGSPAKKPVDFSKETVTMTQAVESPSL